MCTINTWDEFKVKFKRQFFLNNVVYNARRKLRELKHTRSILDYVRKFMTLTLQIPDLTSGDIMFHFMEGLQNWAK